MIIGVDIGTQSLKVCLVDDDLDVVSEASTPYAPEYPKPGWAQQDPALWERALGKTIASALEAVGVAPDAVDGIGIAGQLDGCVPTGADGAAIGPCLIWSDKRAAGELADVAADELRRATGITVDASHMAAKIRWLGASHAARFHQPVSYLVSRLTGEHVYDHGNASTTMLYDLAARDHTDALLELFGVRRDQLPRVDEATARAGELTAAGAALCGLPAGTPVAVGTGDDFSTPLGAGLIEPGRAACVLGTAEVVGALSASPAIDARGLVETHAYPGGQYFVENPGWLAGGAVEWFRKLAGLHDPGELDAAAEQAPPGSGGVTFLPALAGAMAPEWIATARGCFYGLTPAHDARHMARAVLEGCAFAMRDVLDRIAALGVATETILLLGGGAHSKVWAQIRADLMGMHVEIPSRVDTSPLGAAMLAAVAAGLQPDLETCASLVAGTADIVDPSADRADVYEGAYARYQQLFESLRPMF